MSTCSGEHIPLDIGPSYWPGRRPLQAFRPNFGMAKGKPRHLGLLQGQSINFVQFHTKLIRNGDIRSNAMIKTSGASTLHVFEKSQTSVELCEARKACVTAKGVKGVQTSWVLNTMCAKHVAMTCPSVCKDCLALKTRILCLRNGLRDMSWRGGSLATKAKE